MAEEARTPRRVFAPDVTIDDLKEYMGPFVERLGYKFNTETDFVDEVLISELAILSIAGDVYCPCRMRTGDPKEDLKIVCPCIPFYRDQFSALRKCWCGLFIRADVQDGAELIGVIEQPEQGTPVEVPAFSLQDLAPGTARHIKIGRSDIAVVRVDDEIYALSNVCRHAFAPLSEGYLDGHVLICPWHGWRYDVRDGTTDHPNADVKTFPATVRDGIVFVTVPLGS